MQRYRPGACIEKDVKGHGIVDEVVTVKIPPAASLLIDEYQRLLNAFDDDDLSGIVWLVSGMFRMLREGLVENGGRTVNGDRCWRPTEKAKQLGIHHGLDVPVGPLPANWRWQFIAEMDEIASWYVGFLFTNLLQGPSGPLIELISDDDGAKDVLIADLQRFLAE